MNDLVESLWRLFFEGRKVNILYFVRFSHKLACNLFSILNVILNVIFKVRSWIFVIYLG